MLHSVYEGEQSGKLNRNRFRHYTAAEEIMRDRLMIQQSETLYVSLLCFQRGFHPNVASEHQPRHHRAAVTADFGPIANRL